MLPGDTRVIQIVASAPSVSADLSNTAEVHAVAPSDPDPDNNEDTETASARRCAFRPPDRQRSVLLAVNPEGYIGAADGTDSAAGPGGAGLQSIPTGNDALAAGCLGEVRGVADKVGDFVERDHQRDRRRPDEQHDARELHDHELVRGLGREHPEHPSRHAQLPPVLRESRPVRGDRDDHEHHGRSR